MNKKIFVSFAGANENLKNIFINQAISDEWPYEFVQMPGQKSWDSVWREECTRKMRECDCLLVIVTKATKKSHSQAFEVECAKKEGIPCKGIYGSTTNRPRRLPSKLSFVSVIEWDWDKIRNWIINI